MVSQRLLMISTHGYVSACPKLGMPDTGGQVVYVLELSKALAARGFEVDILTRGFEDQPLYEPVADGVRIRRVKYGGDEFRPKELLARFVPELARSYLRDIDLVQRDYDLINSHYWDAGIAGVWLARHLRIPHIHTPHSLGLLKQQNRGWGQAGASSADHLDERIRSERVVYHHADLVVTTAAEQSRCLNESDEYNVNDEKIVQIPPGFDHTLFHPLREDDRQTLRQKLGWFTPTVFAAGRVARSKGYDLLLRAFPAVVQRIPDAKLVLAIGSEDPTDEEQVLLNELTDLAGHLGIADRTTITPSVNQLQLADWYRAADVFVLCSRNEPFGMTAIEAMASGIPTVVSTHGGLWEELTWGQDCIYCDPLDSDALAQAIYSPLAQPRIRQQLASGGASTALSRYTWNEVARQILNCCTDQRWLRSPASFDLVMNEY